MHYIRFLRAPALRTSHRPGAHLDLVLTITNDLGESLLGVKDRLELVVILILFQDGGSPAQVHTLSARGQLTWKPGSRVIKATLDVPPGLYAQMGGSGAGRPFIQVRTISPDITADTAGKIWDVSMKAKDGEGLIMPAWYCTRQGSTDGAQDQVVHRRLRLGEPRDITSDVMIGEEIKDSIARHVWDGGVTALCAVAAAMGPSPSPVGPAVQQLVDVLRAPDGWNILELGCGVGTLGLGLAKLCDMMEAASPRDSVASNRRILMTDLEDAEEIVDINLDMFVNERLRLEGNQKPEATSSKTEDPNQEATRSKHSGQSTTEIAYENLDWEKGRQGYFGDKVSSSAWDLIVLSDCTYNSDTLAALVDTLSALHRHNAEKTSPAAGKPTKMFLATKHRHESELEAFDLLRKADWELVADQMATLPFLESDSQRVQLCLFEKR